MYAKTSEQEVDGRVGGLHCRIAISESVLIIFNKRSVPDSEFERKHTDIAADRDHREPSPGLGHLMH